MKIKSRNFLVGFIVLAILIQPVFINANVSSAVVYLQAQDQDPWITQALVASGIDSPPVNHLTQVSGILATDYAKAILALSAAGENPATFGNIDYVSKLKTYFNNNQMGDQSLLNDDMWSILALSSVGEINSNEAVAAKNYLLSYQNTDGGWGYAINGDSDTNDTAVAIMALVESGMDAADSVIASAITYLKSAQNDDGGFGWTVGSNSDSGSDSWVISALYKINQEPANWIKNNNNPIANLQSLQDADGGFWWVEPGTSDFNNKAMTAYAVIALSGKSFPVDYYNSQDTEEPGTYHLRIEGKNNNICDTYIAGDTAIDLIKNAIDICNYTYVITNSSFGSYLSQINNEAAEGMSGWMYFVNDISPSVGAADYVLTEGDEILWYYGEWGLKPTRLTVNKNNLNSGESLTIIAEYFDGQSWLPLEAAIIKGGDQTYTTNSGGEIAKILLDGYYVFYAQKNGFVRSNKKVVLVGQEDVSQNISLVVEVDQSSSVSVGGEAIIFEVTPSDINFGKLKPGNNGLQELIITNSGTVNLEVAASVSGDSLFTNNLKLNSSSWSNYVTNLAVDEDKEVEVSLPIPESYIQSGVKTGELIFWAQSQ